MKKRRSLCSVAITLWRQQDDACAAVLSKYCVEFLCKKKNKKKNTKNHANEQKKYFFIIKLQINFSWNSGLLPQGKKNLEENKKNIGATTLNKQNKTYLQTIWSEYKNNIITISTLL